ncbi:MAG: hypothetical protein PVJ07_09020 [Anaerolineales bacterium]|jgi:hypothetical protein
MRALWIGLLGMGVLVVVMGLLDRKWGNASWRVRVLTGCVITLGGVYLLLTS